MGRVAFTISSDYQPLPPKLQHIPLDAYAASHRALREMKEDGELPSRVQGSIQPVLEQSGRAGPSESEATNPADAGIQAIRQPVVTISGIELAEKIKKGQFKTGKLGGCDATLTELWNAALSA